MCKETLRISKNETFQNVFFSQNGQKAEAADLDEGDLALAFFTVVVFDGDFSIMLDPALPTQNVMNT